ncbi:hypothetical protein [Pedobacter caeni]|uniref:Uncharacterized protein n=1 Tax=Pedobacter caeni TaxID=288992 RepID=A0A1M5AB74_9SPHI|nr:hypothetical protein [Pedobacter caeni]SHF27528.1 hypothetical protein SAMN04488522_102670 [Pedobacter caeni]
MNLNTAEAILKDTGIFKGHETIAGIACTIGYDKKFKWAWMATQLNTFIIIGETEELIDKNKIEQFSNACYEYAIKNNQGWPRGLQSGIGAVAILKGKSIDRSAAVFCEKLTKKHFSAFEVPVLYDLEKKKTIRYLTRPLWGTIYFPYFTKMIDDITSRF